MSSLNRRTFLGSAALSAPLLATGACVADASPGGAAASVAEPVHLARQERHGGRVLPGADQLAAQRWKPLAGRRVGVVANPTAVLTGMTHIVDDMVAANVKPVAVFGPEHGFRGTAQAGGSEGTYQDPRTGITVYDAYGATADELAGMYRKAGVDTVVFDIANIGVRFYTYTWTMYTAMRAAVATGASFLVLDRPNPIGGRADGPLLDPKFSSGVGLKPVVTQMGMTSGELARMFDAEFLPADTGGKRLGRKLGIAQVSGWRRDELFDDTGLIWVPPSPNLPTLDSATLYPGTCLFEGTVFSEGRGTTRPFETIGAPELDWRWAEALTAAKLPGVRFRENYFVPLGADKFNNTTCGGVQVYVTDRRAVQAVRTGLTMIVTAKKLYPTQFGWRDDNYIDKLYGSDRLRTMVDAGKGVAEIMASYRRELAGFERLRKQYLIYR